MKKVLSFLLIVVMVWGTLAACTSPNEKDTSQNGENTTNDNLNLTGYPLVNEKITYTMMGSKASIQGDWKDLLVFNMLEEKTNVAFDYNDVNAQVFEEKKNLALANGEYPDVFFGAGLNNDQQVKYGEQGILIPLEGYFEEYCPEITKMFEIRPEIKKSITAPDGHIYALPQVYALVLATPSAWVNKKWLDKLGISEDQLPTTIEGLYDMFVRMKNEDPNGNGEQDEYAFSMQKGTAGNNSFYDLLQAFGIPARGVYVDDNDKVQYGYLHPDFKTFLEWCNKVWSEGLVDPDSFTQDASGLAAKGTNNIIGVAFHAIPQLIYGVTDPEEAAKYPVLPALSSKISSKRMTLQNGTGVSVGVFALTDKCKNPEVMMRWIDYLYSEEGSILVHYGPEGKIWEWADESTGIRKYIQPTDGRNLEEVRGGDITPDCGTALPKWIRDETEGNWDDAQQQARVKQVGENLLPFARLPIPDLFFTADEQKQIDIMKTDIDKYTTENAAKFITGDLPLDQYDDFTSTLESMKMDEYLKLYQKAYDRWKNAK